MAIDLKNTISGVKSTCKNKVHDSIQKTGAALNDKLNDKMNSAKASAEADIANKLADAEKALKEKYPTDPDKVKAELDKQKQALTDKMTTDLKTMYNGELTAIQGKLDDALKIQMAAIGPDILNLLKNPMASVENMLKNLAISKVNSIESKLGNIEGALGNKIAKQIVGRAMRNSSNPIVRNIFGKASTSVTNLVNTSIKKFDKSMRTKIDADVKKKSLDKITDLSKKSTDALKGKISGSISSVMTTRIKKMIGRDIKWPQ